MLKSFYLLIIFLGIAASGLFAQQNQLLSIGALSQQHPDSALIILKKMYAQAVDKKDDITEGRCLQQMGQICYNQGHFAQALEFYIHADKIFSVNNQPDLQAANLGETGVLYYYNKQMGKSRVMYNKALAIYKQNNNLKGQAEILGNIGHLYEKSRQYDSAFYYQNLALKTYNQANYKKGAAKIYENLGSIYEDLARYDSSYVCFEKSLRLYNEEHNEVASIEVVNNLGDILRKTGRYAESVVQSRRAMALARQTGNIYQLAACSKDLGKVYQLMNRMDSAYHYAELSRKYSLEIYSKDGVNQTAFLQVLYDMDKKSNEIMRLNNIRKMNQVIVVAVGVVVVLVVVLGLVIFSRQRLKIKDQHTLAKQKEAEHLVMQLQIKNQQLEEESLKQQLELKSRELSNHTLNLIRNNQLLENMRATLQAMVKDDKRDQKKQMQQIILQINDSFNHEQHWKEFTTAFEQVHQQFFESIKQHSNELTSTDMRLIALLRINLNSNDIAALLGISVDSLRVSRYRLRKKLNISQGGSLTAFIQSL
ncbi:tetratricopeptide repeat protein [Mucilaginibacter paludis]|uniref:Tetratricopeptide TPR_1 repeat-containing protein n=1 Tax=Mucilaginibacter paludis DSM 18603 TaxID=714943 RepID=H1YBH7_9SPHI|nr:tetratricopeptide repeat protein [Mucilaginibacter paludis]EHQ25048.1 Tetratricopeptide TPR_1 repeat-containing protein [Mucilaginibacter paludis DSM 18603]